MLDSLLQEVCVKYECMTFRLFLRGQRRSTYHPRRKFRNIPTYVNLFLAKSLSCEPEVLAIYLELYIFFAVDETDRIVYDKHVHDLGGKHVIFMTT